MSKDIYLDSVPDYYNKSIESEDDILKQILNKPDSDQVYCWQREYYNIGPKGIELVGLVQKILQAIKGFFGFTQWTSITRVNLEMMKRFEEGLNRGILTEAGVKSLIAKLKDPDHVTVKDYLGKKTADERRQHIMMYFREHRNDLNACCWYRSCGDLDSGEIKSYGDTLFTLANDARTRYQYAEAFEHLKKIEALKSSDPAFEKKLFKQSYDLFRSFSWGKEHLAFIVDRAKLALDRKEYDSIQPFLQLVPPYLKQELYSQIGEYYLEKGLQKHKDIVFYLYALATKYDSQKNDKGLETVADIYWDNQLVNDAILSYEKVVKRCVDTKKQADLYAKIGDGYCKMQQWKNALPYYKYVIDLKSSDSALYLAICDKALFALKQIINVERDELWKLSYLKEALEWSDCKSQFVSKQDQAAILKEKAKSCDTLSDGYFKRADYDQAFKYYNMAAGLDITYQKKVVDKYLEYANTFKDDQKKIEPYKKAYGLYPSIYHDHIRVLLKYYIDNTMAEEAHILYCRHSKWKKKVDVSVDYAIGQLVERSGKLQDAIDCYAEAKKKAPADKTYVYAYFQATFKLVDELNNNGNLDSALQHLKSFLDTCRKVDRTKKLEDLFLGMKKKYVEIALNAAKAKQQKNDVEGAIQYLEGALNTIQEDKYLDEVKKELVVICNEEARGCIKKAYLKQRVADYDDDDIVKHLNTHDVGLKNALRYYDILTKVDPENAAYHFDKAELLDLFCQVDAKWSKQCLEEYKQAKTLNNKNPFYHRRLFEKLNELNMTEEATKIDKEFHGTSFLGITFRKSVDREGFCYQYIHWQDNLRFQDSTGIDPHTFSEEKKK